MEYLAKNIKQLPQAVFLDLNMPRKNGAECLTEIRQNKKLKDIPVVVYSTDFHPDILDLLYKYGAFYCIRKSADEKNNIENLSIALNTISEDMAMRPAREHFVLGFENKPTY
jgi:DNA-binding NarL/FixJ family response regulator